MPSGLAFVYIMVAIGILAYGVLDFASQRRRASLTGSVLAALVLVLLAAPELMIINLFVRFNWTGAVGSWVLSGLHRATRLSILTYGGLLLAALALVAPRVQRRKGRKGRAHPPRR